MLTETRTETKVRRGGGGRRERLAEMPGEEGGFAKMSRHRCNYSEPVISGLGNMQERIGVEAVMCSVIGAVRLVISAVLWLTRSQP
jgi:hypothetical protein